MIKLILKYAVAALLAVLIWYLGSLVAAEWMEFGRNENNAGPTSCTAEAKMCPDGSAVGRTGPNCEFAPCPDIDPETDNDTMSAIEMPAEGFTIPWGLAFLPDGDLLISERPGTLTKIDSKDNMRRMIEVSGVKATGEGGLLGIALHPAFTQNHFVYLYMTAPDNGGTKNKVVRFTYVEGALTNEVTIIDDIPGASYHDGGRIAFGPDGLLYITTGDAGEPERAQDIDSLAGKILRLAPDGAIPEGNPFNNPVYSYGHRNPQGITWDAEGDLWSTEHGRSGIRSGLDELNLIEAGANYGWPDSQGDTVLERTIAPILHSGPDVTWAPASAVFVDGSIFFGGLRGRTLYEAVINENNEVTELKKHLVEEYGRMRTVAQGPDGMLYITTSNADGRAEPQEGDDRIIRIDPNALED